MKKIYVIILIVTCAFTSSCSDSLLDIDNNNTVSTGNFWNSEEDINRGVIAVYNMFYKQGTWTRNIYTQMNGSADDGVSYAGWTELQEWSKFIYTNYNFDEVNTKIWGEHYKAIFRANQVLDHINDVPFSNEEKRNDLIGQTKFLRAFYYFYLTVLYEDVPLVLTTSSASDRPEQKKMDEIFVQIESDLKDAIEKLPVKREAANVGRITKGAAYALLGKMYMQAHRWDDARKCFEWLVDGDGKSLYELMDNYEANFRNDTENNKESVLEIQFSQLNNTGFDVDFDPNSNLGSQIAINHSPKGLGWNNLQARRWLIDYFKREKTVDGTNDLRLYYSLWYDDAATDFPEIDNHLIYGRTWDEDPTWGDQVFIKKYTSKLSGRETEFYWHDINFRLIRFSDVLLLYAEALNELSSTPSAKAVECMNRVRERAKLPKIENSTYYNGTLITSNKDAFREQIKIERALELNLECVRWIDLKRWGLDQQSVIDQYKQRDEDFKNFVVGKSYRMPIPQSEVDNNPNLQQNYPY
ncbi:RagB/SusD family nutrient uptake outer membrane protein [Dysgonomonas sp. Marseille-P4677]|uniref:RagB/SusD family nutrient uptake outer membrane protein n=1 Tax=Dysgonomonas sp. Marseille-P4677 TaxID=2364790 RepID=UPI0019117251|nr:RagB/SusD family nutrient uptake outer membrane protein [Dysgonomonas sp. Marseille-P4677]MBK5720656.1 RagB/SusD family nutrient uptake outer membrane protein [Dysgonomonas sp. Marseille-P4677]